MAQTKSTINRPFFPQADSLTRVIATVAAARTTNSVSDIAATFGITGRQLRYYADAAAYMGLAVRLGSVITPTASGTRIAGYKSERSRLKAISAILETRPVFGRAIKALRAGKPPARLAVAGWIQRNTKLAPVTAMRRAATVQSWTAAVA